jgi:hypothetical protein
MAERQVWQQKGELSKVGSEQLLEATQVYVDLLLARAGEEVSAQIEAQLRELLELSKKRKDFLAGGQIETIEAEVFNQQQVRRSCGSSARRRRAVELPAGVGMLCRAGPGRGDPAAVRPRRCIEALRVLRAAGDDERPRGA